MFYYISGTVGHTEQGLAVIDAGGVGYACHTSSNTLQRIRVGQQAKLFTHLIVREDVFDLYGFYDHEEMACFKMLIGISGVGPRAALSILSVCTPGGLALSIITGDEKALTAAPGIGKKLAQRVMLELRDKIAKTQLESVNAASAGMELAASASGPMAEAMAALSVLGYSQSEAAMALQGLDSEGMSAEEIIRSALKRLASAVK